MLPKWSDALGLIRDIPYRPALFARAIVMRPDLHPCAAILEVLCGPRRAEPSSAQLRRRLDEDLRLFSGDEAMARHLYAAWGRRIAEAERREGAAPGGTL